MPNLECFMEERMRLPNIYTKEIYKRFRYLANWLPNSPLEVGDIGVLRQDHFEYVTTLSSLGIVYELRFSEQSIDLTYTSDGCVEINFDVQGESDSSLQVVNGVTALVRVSFSKENSTLFAARGCRSVQVTDINELGSKIIEVQEREEWMRNWCVVTETLIAESATVILSKSRTAELEMASEGQIGQQLIHLADTSAGLKLRSAKG